MEEREEEKCPARPQLVDVERPLHVSRLFSLQFYNVPKSASWKPDTVTVKKDLLLTKDLEIKMDQISTFPGALPYTLTKQDVTNVLYDPTLEYVCSPKSDGERMMMVIFQKEAWMVNRRFQWKKWIGLPSEWLDDLAFTILDVELLEFHATATTTKTTSTQYTSWDIQVFDVIVFRGRSVCDALYQERLQHWMNMLLYWVHVKRRAKQIDYLSPSFASILLVDPYVRWTMKPIFYLSKGKWIWKTFFPEHGSSSIVPNYGRIDGLIFTPNRAPIFQGHHHLMFKWKPPQYQTIDTMATCIDPERLLWKLTVKSFGTTDPIRVIEEQVYWKPNETPDTGLERPFVVECKWDVSSGKWTPIRSRHREKKEANQWTVVMNVKQALQDNLTVHDLFPFAFHPSESFQVAPLQPYHPVDDRETTFRAMYYSKLPLPTTLTITGTKGSTLMNHFLLAKHRLRTIYNQEVERRKTTTDSTAAVSSPSECMMIDSKE